MIRRMRSTQALDVDLMKILKILHQMSNKKKEYLKK